MTGTAPGDIILVETLRLAVPLRIAELLRMTEVQRVDTIRFWAAEACEVVASNGDNLMFRTKPWRLKGSQLAKGSRRKPGDEVSTADTFNHLAAGLAALAMCPGGVLFAGVHWCAEHPLGKEAANIADLTCSAAGTAADTPQQPRKPRKVESITVAAEML